MSVDSEGENVSLGLIVNVSTMSILNLHVICVCVC